MRIVRAQARIAKNIWKKENNEGTSPGVYYYLFIITAFLCYGCKNGQLTQTE